VSSIAKLALCVLAAAALAASQTKKNYKDQGEYDAYNEVAKSMAAGNFAKAAADLDAWKQKYPASDFAADRDALYVQVYAAAKQPDKSVGAAAGLLAGDIDATVGNPGTVIKVLFTTCTAVQQIADPTPEQLATAKKAATLLAAYEKKPEGLTDDAWKQARTQLHTAASATLIYAALAPGAQAMRKKDCAGAENVFAAAMREYPESGQAAYSLGTAQLCLYNANQPAKASPAIYAIARAAAVDPAKGMVDPKWQKETVEPYLRKIYGRYHGEDPEGLKKLLEAAKGSPTPPEGFHLKSVTEIAEEKEKEFAQSNPQLALWMKVKGALAAPDGESYFATSLKDAAVPQLRGVLVEAKPPCRPKELLVGVALPDGPKPPPAEILVKLDKPLAGKPEPGTEFQWQGVPVAFTAAPFQLTMDTESAKLDGLKTSPCAVAPVRKALPKKK
jgi:hypothetical protein